MKGFVAPRFGTRRQAKRYTFGDEVAEVAWLLGVELMPHQRHILDVGLEWRRRPETPYRSQILASLPRQNGKTLLVGALAIWRAHKWPDQSIALVAQTRGAAAERLSSWATLLQRAGWDVTNRRAIGSESLTFPNGSQIKVYAPADSALHGATNHMVLLDEMRFLGDEILAAAEPTMTTVPTSQLWVISTRGDESAETMNRMVDHGRDSVTDAKSPMAYFEWSADVDAGDDPFNPEHWERWMPAIDRTVDRKKLEAQLQAPGMTSGKWLREYGNLLTATSEAWIDPGLWGDTLDRTAVPQRPLVLGFDVNLTPSGASLGVAHPHNNSWHIDLHSYEPGESVMWLVPRIRDAIQRLKPVAVVAAGGGPVRGIVAEVKALCESSGIQFRSATTGDLAAASGLMWDSLRTGDLTHGDAPALHDAAMKVQSRSSGDAQRFDRRSRVDVSPLYATSLAYLVGREFADQRTMFIRSA